MFRVLLKLKKDDAVKYISHLDLVRAFEFALRRAQIPVAYSAGFNPRPKMSFSTATGVGVASDDERLMLELAHQEPAEDVMDRLNHRLPPGLQITSAETVPEDAKSPLTGLNASDFRISVSCSDCSKIDPLLREIIASEEYRIVRKRKKELKEVDIRKLIINTRVSECNTDTAVIELSVKTTSSGGGRPQDIIQVLQSGIPDLTVLAIKRLRQYHIED